MHPVPAGHWDLSENASEKLEDVESFALWIAGEGVLVGRLTFIEESASPWCPVDTRERKRASQQLWGAVTYGEWPSVTAPKPFGSFAVRPVRTFRFSP